MRGKLGNGSQRNAPERLIPAGAGKTFTELDTLHSPAAHPRRCGENVFLNCAARITYGSSPQVRGKLTAVGLHAVSIRLIPAGAGNMGRTFTPSKSVGAHPRGCGEHVEAFYNAYGIEGSSPRVRGTWFDIHTETRAGGLIPAGAGNIG